MKNKNQEDSLKDKGQKKEKNQYHKQKKKIKNT